MSKIYYIDSADLLLFAGRIAGDFDVFVPQLKADNFTCEKDYSWRKFSAEDRLAFNPYRAGEPLKAFFTFASEKVADYFAAAPEASLRPAVIFGVKACDIAGHKIQDFVFLEGAATDHLYRRRRENTVIISGDCTDFKSVCHCLAWEIMPYPLEGFDLNLSPLNDGYLVEVGSQKGEGLVTKYKEFFSSVKETQLSARDAKRQSLVQSFRKHLLPQNLVARDSVQGLIRKGYRLDTWKEFMQTCVECGGCNFICDTCHCFLLADQKSGQNNQRLRLWDSCQYANYARVGGGANPLKLRAQRLRFRFSKKFDFFVDNLGVPACCGCGRCIEVCPGKIDIREVLKDLARRLEPPKT